MYNFRRIGKRSLTAIIIIALLLVAFRACLPFLVQRYVNRKLDSIPGYTGRIGDVDIHLWRGAYSVHDIKLLKTGGRVPVPFFECSVADFSIQWKALFQGKAVGELEIERPVLNFVAAPSGAESQTEIDSEWLSAVKDLFPLRLNRFAIHDGEVHFRNFHSKPRVDIKLNRIRLEGKNFSNTRSPTEGLKAEIFSKAFVQNTAPLEVKAELEPAAVRPTFQLGMATREIPVTALNDFLEAYAAIDAENGTLGVDFNMECNKGRCTGLVKPIARDLEIFRIKTDLATQNPLQTAWEGFMGLLSEIFENQRHTQLATEIKFSGSFDNQEVSLWHAIATTLYNAFVEALKPGYDMNSSREQK